MAKPKNIIELRDGLLEAFDMVRADPRRMNQVSEMVNAAGKIINSIKVELEYHDAKKKGMDAINFMEK